MGKPKKTTTFGEPGALALARFQVGGDLVAAILLYRLKWRWQMEKKLVRFNKEWIAMSRSDWAREAGLSEAQMKNRALPKLRECDFVTIRQMKITPSGPKLLWMHLELAMLPNTYNQPFELHELKMNGGEVIGADQHNTKISKKGAF